MGYEEDILYSKGKFWRLLFKGRGEAHGEKNKQGTGSSCCGRDTGRVPEKSGYTNSTEQRSGKYDK